MELINYNNSATSIFTKQEEDKLKKYYKDSISTNTKKSLFIKWNKFVEWSQDNNKDFLPASEKNVALFLISLRENKKKISTIMAYHWAIIKINKEHGNHTLEKSIFLKNEIKGIKRNIIKQDPDLAFPLKKEAFIINDIKRCNFPNNIKGLRDKALLLVGFASGMRSSELSKLEIDRISPIKNGIKIQIIQSKTNQEGALEYVSIVKGLDPNWCPVRILDLYISEAKIRVGYIFRACLKGNKISKKPISPDMIRKIVKNYAHSIGRDPRNYGAHSLRSGCATYFLDKEVKPHIVQKQLRHKSLDTTLGYNRNTSIDELSGLY